MDPDETPEQAVVRELREETGLECTVGRYLGGFTDVYGETGDATLNLAFACAYVGGDPVAADDVSELRWFAPADLPAADAFGFPSSVAILAAWTASGQDG